MTSIVSADTSDDLKKLFNTFKDNGFHTIDSGICDKNFDNKEIFAALSFYLNFPQVSYDPLSVPLYYQHLTNLAHPFFYLEGKGCHDSF